MFSEAFPKLKGRVCPTTVHTGRYWFLFPASLITAGQGRTVPGDVYCQRRERKESSGRFLPGEHEDIDDLFHSLSKVIMYLGSLKMCISFLWQTRTASLVPV